MQHSSGLGAPSSHLETVPPTLKPDTAPVEAFEGHELIIEQQRDLCIALNTTLNPDLRGDEHLVLRIGNSITPKLFIASNIIFGCDEQLWIKRPTVSTTQ